MSGKPRIFVGSASESLDVAETFYGLLENHAEVTVWKQATFRLTRTTLESLLEQLPKYDFAIFVFTPDDEAIIRDDKTRVVRDNVLFELGLFTAALGRNRCFVVAPNGQEALHLPTDLLGITIGSYNAHRSDHNLEAALAQFAGLVRREIHTVDRDWDRREPLIEFDEKFRTVDWKKLLSSATNSVDIAVYYFDSWVNANFESLVDFFRRPDTRVRVFVTDPRDDDLFRHVSRLFPESTADVLRAKIAHTGQRFANAVAAAGAKPDQFEFYFTPNLLTYSAQAVDDKHLVLSIYEMYRQSRIDSPAVQIDLDASSHLASFWAKELRGLLTNSEKIDPLGEWGA